MIPGGGGGEASDTEVDGWVEPDQGVVMPIKGVSEYPVDQFVMGRLRRLLYIEDP
jgi:hypothetical protein